MVTLARRVQRVPFAPVVAVLFGIVAAILVAAVPKWLFEKAVVASGLPTLLAAAAPPLGLAARIMAIALAFAVVAFVLWAVLTSLAHLLEARKRARTPWRDAGYDADTLSSSGDMMPPRRPIFAPDELGAPLMSDEAIALVAPLDTALPEFMSEPALAQPVVAEEVAPVTETTIAALISRFEDGLARKVANDSAPQDPGGTSMPPPSASWTVPAQDLGGERTDDGDDVIRQGLGTSQRMARR